MCDCQMGPLPSGREISEGLVGQGLRVPAAEGKETPGTATRGNRWTYLRPYQANERYSPRRDLGKRKNQGRPSTSLKFSRLGRAVSAVSEETRWRVVVNTRRSPTRPPDRGA